MGEPALLLVDVAPVTRPLIVNDVIVRAVAGAKLVVQECVVRVDGPQRRNLAQRLFLGAIRVGGQKLHHGVGQTAGQLVLENVDAVVVAGK